MWYLLIALVMLLGPASSAQAQISVGIGVPGISIGINVPVYPQLVLVPGYPVYYDPQAGSNYFFYDGLYWVYQGDNWYMSSWFNGPWQLVGPDDVPLFVLRVPVRYYRDPPAYFRGWRADAPPRWGEHWGRDWEARRGGWDRWDHRTIPRAAPLPTYQRQYAGNRYPGAEEQQTIRSQHYRYRPREAVAQQHLQQPSRPGSARAERPQSAPVPQRESTQQRQQPQPGQPGRLTQPMQPPPQAQRPQASPQDRGRGNEAAPQVHARGNTATPQDRGRENRNEEHGQEHR